MLVEAPVVMYNIYYIYREKDCVANAVSKCADVVGVVKLCWLVVVVVA